ncbi:MAG: histidine--tRNA ligase [Nevskiaceae bacterium]|nr:MAG: histidine--tRNA ligase [Nevskiaceae bacterium]TBR73669.1 MAG: histidine--tRNA ligase [Nevskiaceae bacterium]
MTARVQAVRGMNDVLPPETGVWQHVRDCARTVMESYGYGEILLPLVERAELFNRAVGEVTDVVEKEMYVFEDRGGEALALRPEGTAGCVRACIEHGLLHNQQQRFWYFGPMFRYERPQAGRYRQFHQVGVEAYGMAGPDIDVEVIAAGSRFLRRLGFRGLQLHLNSLGTPAVRTAYRQALVDFLQAHAPQLDADSQQRIARNPLRVLDSKVPATQAILADAPSILDYLDTPSRVHFDGLQQGLSDLGIACVVDPRLVRGLDYYTHGVFEWQTTELGAQGTVCAGGRYDGLVEQLGGEPTPAVGFASGVERLVLLLQQQAAAATGALQVYVCGLDAESQRVALRECERVRDALPALQMLVHAGGGSLKSQLRRANASGARYALVLGSREVEDGVVQVKSLRGEREPELVAWRDVAPRLMEYLAAPPVSAEI